MESKAAEGKTRVVNVVSLVKKAKEARSIEKRNNLFIVLAFSVVLIVTGLIISL
tara:strand:+ start:4449 stop:4610 length:162 start_codon:yes stop_codon:yes gene_type:complete